MSAAIKDNKKAEEAANNEVKKLLDIKTNSSNETCPHRKTPVSQDIGTLFYDGKLSLIVFARKYQISRWMILI